MDAWRRRTWCAVRSSFGACASIVRQVEEAPLLLQHEGNLQATGKQHFQLCGPHRARHTRNVQATSVCCCVKAPTLRCPILVTAGMELHRRRCTARPWALLLLSIGLVHHLTAAIVIEQPSCSRMIHVSGEFTHKLSLEISPIVAKELVPVSPFHACEPIDATTDLAGRIALVQRGECNFVKKVRHAQRAGAVAVVVMDNELRTEPPFHTIMQKDENASHVAIPGVFVSFEDGERLLQLIHTATPWSPVMITISDVGELPYNKTEYRMVKRAIAYIFLVSAVCALSSGLSIVLSFIFSTIGKTWRSRVTKRMPLMIYRPLLQQELLELAMREVDVLDRIMLDEDEEPLTNSTNDTASAPARSIAHPTEAEMCSICLDDFVVGERVKVLPCQHFFHVECIDPWLEKRNGSCPLCKQDAIAVMDDAPKSICGLTLPRMDQILRQESWFHGFFLMLPASLVSCLIVNSAVSVIRTLWP